MPPSSRRCICSVSRRSGSGSYSTMASLLPMVAGDSPRSGSGSVLALWTLLMTGGVLSRAFAFVFERLDLPCGVYPL